MCPARRLLALILLLALTVLLALIPTFPVAAAAPTYRARLLCSITDPRITESSGLAADGGSLYTLDDGGDALTVYVLDRACHVRQVVSDPTDPYDVEDLARTPDGTLWLSDTGDNSANRDTVAIETLRPGARAGLYRLRYPDGAHDAEALLLDRNRRPYIVTKEPLGVSGVYTPQAPLVAGATVPLRKVTDLHFSLTGTDGGPVGPVSQLLVTGGAVSADGRHLALRTYTDLYLWDAPDGDVAAALTSGHPQRIPLPATKQGEAVTFDGSSLLTSTEGSPAPVYELTPTAPPPGSPRPSGPAAAGSSDPTHDDGDHRVLVVAVAVAVVLGVALLLGRLVRRR